MKSQLLSTTLIRFASIATFWLLILVVSVANAQDGDAANGETIFKNNCKSCHNANGNRLVGPGLKDISKRRDLAWLVKWVKNPQAVLKSGDDYAKKIYAEAGNAQMTAFANYGEKEVKDVIAYVDKFNTAPPVVAGVAAVGGGAAQSGAPSDMFTYILVALLVVMLVVLGVLLSVVGLLSKTVNGNVETVSDKDGSFIENLRNNLTLLAKNSAVRTASIMFFSLIVTKATIDGLYGIGVQQGYAPKQPIAFSHKLHAGEYKIDCNYCHTGVNRGKSAHIPSANICMNCHGEIKRESPEIQKIYAAIETDKPIEWVRVHNLPDLAYFNHAQHVNVGNVQCSQCHGEIEKMEVVQQRSSLTMGWCIDCHRKTEVNTKDNAYYDKMVQMHNVSQKEGALKVVDIGGLECSKCHY